MSEGPSAFHAGVRFLSCVDELVRDQRLRSGEALAADGTREVFLARVGVLVPRQVL